MNLSEVVKQARERINALATGRLYSGTEQSIERQLARESVPLMADALERAAKIIIEAARMLGEPENSNSLASDWIREWNGTAAVKDSLTTESRTCAERDKRIQDLLREQRLALCYARLILELNAIKETAQALERERDELRKCLIDCVDQLEQGTDAKLEMVTLAARAALSREPKP